MEIAIGIEVYFQLKNKFIRCLLILVTLFERNEKSKIGLWDENLVNRWKNLWNKIRKEFKICWAPFSFFRDDTVRYSFRPAIGRLAK